MTSLSAAVSCLDTSKTIDESNWAITMIRVPNDVHAELIIEGVKDGKKFTYLAHLTGSAPGPTGYFGYPVQYFTKYGQVDTGYLKSGVKYGGKSETWITTKEKIETILFPEIEKDKADNHRTPFNILGKDSIAATKVPYIDLDNPLLVEYKNKDPKYFKELCYSYAEFNFIEKPIHSFLKLPGNLFSFSDW
jgi:hypothetical protein